MKTIAISIDEASLAAVDHLARAGGRGRPGKKAANRSDIRCDFLALMFKSKLTTLVASLPERKLAELNDALAVALDLA